VAIIQLENINFAYQKKEPVLTEVNINVPQGSIYGFLGPNGAGKSTTLRLILGLMKPQAGRISLFGENIKSSHPKYLARVGSLIESASLYEHLSATDNLKISAKYFNTPKNQIQGILEKVKLGHTGKKKTNDFSTGMKQRLGLALALQHNPEILILDEPTNGLDPNGIIELREIIKVLNDEGKTILLSSHILSEVEKIVDQIGIINNGSIVFEGSLSDLQEIRCKNFLVKIKVSEVDRALVVLSAYEIKKLDAYNLSINLAESGQMPSVVRKLVNANFDVYEVTPESSDLENMFLNVTNLNVSNGS